MQVNSLDLQNEDNKYLYNKIKGMAESSENKYDVKFTFFLDERQVIQAEKILKFEHIENYELYGGYDEAKRKVLCIYPKYYEIKKEEYPFKRLEFLFRQENKLTHRDFLGVLMSLGIKRETIGDIIVKDGQAIVMAYKTICEPIINEVKNVGKTGVVIRELDSNYIIEVNQQYEKTEGTVSSLRADSVVAMSIKQSRSKVNAMIKAAGIDVNNLHINEPDAEIKEGYIYSVKGYGKYILSEVKGLTKKQRLKIVVLKYI